MVSDEIESFVVWTFQTFGQTVGFLDVIVIVVSIYLLLVLTLGIFQQKSTAIRSQRMTGRPLSGPWNFPIVGYLPKLGSRPFVTMWNLSRRYGCVYQMRMGSHAVVVVSGLETLKEAFVKNGKVFSGRPDFASFKELSRGKSFTFQSYSRDWKVHSKMAARALSSFVRNTSRPIDQLIGRSAAHLAEHLVATHGAAVDVYGFVEDAVMRVIYGLCFGDGVVTDEFCDALKRELFRMRASMPKVMAADILPWLAAFLRPQLREFRRTLRRYERLVDDMTQRCAETGAETGDSTCIVHSLIKAADDLEIESEFPSTSLDKDKILTTIHDLIGAGSEGVVNFIYWAIRYMVAYPDTQVRLREEVNSVITCDRSPIAYKHRSLMPYVECFIWEVVRHSSMSPLTLPHSTLEDTVLCGYLIPKGTVVYGNLYSVSQCADTWKDPEDFRPERFFDESGKAFDRARLESLPCFGLGNRKCIGEVLGRTEMFLFLVILVQNCRFGQSKEDENNCSLETMDGEMSLVYRSKPYKVVVNPVA